MVLISTIMVTVTAMATEVMMAVFVTDVVTGTAAVARAVGVVTRWGGVMAEVVTVVEMAAEVTMVTLMVHR